MELAAALETVRSLQKQLEKMAGPSESSTSLSEKPSTTPVAASPSHPKESPRHHVDSKSDTKKKDPRTKSSGKPKKKDKS